MYRSRLWTMRQFSGFGTAEDTNKRYHYLLEQGQTGLSVAFHLPTLMGYDSDHPMSEGEVGKCGVAIDSLADMEALFDKLPLDKISTSMTTNAPAVILWAMYLVVAEKQHVPWTALRGTIQNDILKEYIAEKTYIFPPRPSMKLVVDTFEFGTRHVPQWNTISISGYHIREAGSTALQELAFTLYDGIEYVEWARRAGLNVDDFAPRLSFFFNAHSDFFEEIAKYRAARKIWYKVMTERFHSVNPRSSCSGFTRRPQVVH
jgi:methylmalonyl-CoA mutase N-terminal domain/subunit